MTNRAKRLRENGFDAIHLFGNFYLCRYVSKYYKCFSLLKYLWIICNLSDDIIVEVFDGTIKNSEY